MRARIQVELLCRRRVHELGSYLVSLRQIEQGERNGDKQINIIQFRFPQAVINLLRCPPVSHSTGEDLGRVEDL